MKAHISSYHSFSSDELAVLDASFDLFLETDSIDGVTSAKKKENDLLAKSVKEKLSKMEPNYNAEELRIMSVVLLNMQIYISDSRSFDADKDFVKQRDKYLKIIKGLLDFLNVQFSAAGIKIP